MNSSNGSPQQTAVERTSTLQWLKQVFRSFPAAPSSCMRAIGSNTHLPIGHENSLQALMLPVPVVSGRSVLVRVQAISVGRMDVQAWTGESQKVSTEPRVLGWEGSGVVMRTGEQVTLFQEGDEVYWCSPPEGQGSHAEYQLLDERHLGLKPTGLTFEEAAAVPRSALTAWEGLVDRLRISERDRGKTLLVIGGASGVGSVVIQLARNAGLHIIATASRTESAAWAMQMGADQVINHRFGLEGPLEGLGFSGVDFIFNTEDPAEHWEACFRMIRPGGGIVVDAATRTPLPLDLLFQRGASVHGVNLFPDSPPELADPIRQYHLLSHVGSMLEAGSLKSPLGLHLGRITPDHLREAHLMLESQQEVGRVVLSGW